jgi:hypothetical protein
LIESDGLDFEGEFKGESEDYKEDVGELTFKEEGRVF